MSKRIRDARLPKPGATRTKEYDGESYSIRFNKGSVTVDGENYASVSAAAKAITGTETNGYTFFDLQPKKSKASTTKQPRKAVDTKKKKSSTISQRDKQMLIDRTSQPIKPVLSAEEITSTLAKIAVMEDAAETLAAEADEIEAKLETITQELQDAHHDIALKRNELRNLI